MKNIKRIKALKMQTREERKIKGQFGSPYLSKAWESRTEAIKARIIKQINRLHVRKAERLQALKEGKQVVYSIK